MWPADYPGPVEEPLLILIPACNEEASLGQVLTELQQTLPTADILVIDDGSSDGTPRVIQQHAVQSLRHPFNLGYGSALLTGYVYAHRHGYQRVVQMDADGQHDPSSVPCLLEALDQGADLAIGSRFLTGKSKASSPLRRSGSWILSLMVKTWTGKRFTDPTSGFQALSWSALEELTEEGFPEDFPDADVLIGMLKAGLKMVEVPVTMHARKSGVSMHRGGRAVFYAFKMLLTLSLLKIRRRSPFRSRSSLLPAR